MSNKKQTTPALFIILLIAGSCSNEPVTPPQPPQATDTIDRFEWTLDTIYGYSIYDLYVADSNNIFFSSPLFLIFYNGSNYEPVNLNEPLFGINTVSGYDRNNVFVGGGRRDSEDYPPILKKVEGKNIYSYNIDGDTGKRISDILVEEPDQAWLCTSEGSTVYHFNSGIFTPYTLDSGVRGGGFFKDSLNTLYYFGLKIFTVNNFWYYIYRYANNSFELINVDSVNYASGLSSRFMMCGSDMIALGSASLYYFANSGWENLCNTGDFRPMSVCGTSKNNLLCFGTIGDHTGNIYTWDGKQWHKEKSEIIPANFYYSVNSAMTNGKVNLIISDHNYFGLSYHLKGIPKTEKQGININQSMNFPANR